MLSNLVQVWVKMAIKLWAGHRLNSHSNHCSPLVPPPQPNMESSSFKMDQKHKMTLTMKAISTLQNGCLKTNGWRHKWQHNHSFKATTSSQLEKPKVCHYIPWLKFHWFYCAVKLIQRSINTHTHTRAHLGSPVQMKGSDLCVVSLEVREIEEVRWGLLLPGLPAEEKQTQRSDSVFWLGRGESWKSRHPNEQE